MRVRPSSPPPPAPPVPEHRLHPASRRLTRALLDGRPRVVLGGGAPWKATLWRCDTPRGAVVVKDVRPMPPLLRHLWGRPLLARELRVYRALRGLAGVPICYGPLDADAFVLAAVDGEPLSSFAPGALPPEFFARLAALVRMLHARGVVHLDLHQRRNILVTPRGEPVVVDFGAALALGRSARVRAVLLPRLARVDHAGWLKFKARHCPERLTDAERALLAWRRRLRPWWPFNLNRRRFRARAGTG